MLINACKEKNHMNYTISSMTNKRSHPNSVNLYTSSTLAAVLAEVSMKIRPCSLANASPSSFFTSLLASRSLLETTLSQHFKAQHMRTCIFLIKVPFKSWEVGCVWNRNILILSNIIPIISCECKYMLPYLLLPISMMTMLELEC